MARGRRSSPRSSRSSGPGGGRGPRSARPSRGRRRGRTSRRRRSAAWVRAPTPIVIGSSRWAARWAATSVRARRRCRRRGGGRRARGGLDRRVLGAGWPRFSSRSTRSRKGVSQLPPTISAVPSLEPSSATITSKLAGSAVCGVSESRQRRQQLAAVVGGEDRRSARGRLRRDWHRRVPPRRRPPAAPPRRRGCGGARRTRGPRRPSSRRSPSSSSRPAIAAAILGAVVGDAQRRLRLEAGEAFGAEAGGDHGLAPRHRLQHLHPHAAAAAHRRHHDRGRFQVRLHAGGVGDHLDAVAGQVEDLGAAGRCRRSAGAPPGGGRGPRA